MPGTITRTPSHRTPGLVNVRRYDWSDCGNFDHEEFWVECHHCGTLVADSEGPDFADGEIEAIEFVHALGLCVIAVRNQEAAARRWVEARTYDGADEEPF